MTLPSGSCDVSGYSYVEMVRSVGYKPADLLDAHGQEGQLG